MRNSPIAIGAALILGVTACVKRVPEPVSLRQGAPHISWIIMSGDRDNPDRDFVCQSDPRNDCVVPVSRPDVQVFSDVHFYYHGAATETRYTGSIRIGFFQGTVESQEIRPNITVNENEEISNQSVTSIVTSQPGTYAMTFALIATSTQTGQTQNLLDEVAVTVK